MPKVALPRTSRARRTPGAASPRWGPLPCRACLLGGLPKHSGFPFFQVGQRALRCSLKHQCQPGQPSGEQRAFLLTQQWLHCGGLQETPAHSCPSVMHRGPPRAPLLRSAQLAIPSAGACHESGKGRGRSGLGYCPLAACMGWERVESPSTSPPPLPLQHPGVPPESYCMARGAIWWPEATPLDTFLPCRQLGGVGANLLASYCVPNKSASFQ